MTNNVLYVNDGTYGNKNGYIAPIMQGQYGQTVQIEVRNLADTVKNLTGYTTITGTLDNRAGTVVPIVGPLSLSATPSAAPNLSWVIDEDDAGTGGLFSVVLSISNGTITYETLPVGLTIVPNPAANATGSPPLVGVSTAQKALLASIAALTGLVEMVAGSATGIAIQTFMRTFLGSASAATALTNIGAASSSDLSTHTGLSTTAHGGILPQDAAIVAVSSGRDLASTDAGKILECTGTFTLTCPNGLDAGFQCALVNVGSGTITIAAATTLQSKDSAVTMPNQYGMATVYHRGSNVWLLAGDIA